MRREKSSGKKAEEPPAESKSEYELRERRKELDCLYGLSQLVENKELSRQETLDAVVDLIPPAMQYPDIACARIRIEDKSYQTSDFKETEWCLERDIKVKGEVVGKVEIYYRKERSELHHGPFLPEEKKLVNAIAERIGTYIQQERLEEELVDHREKLNGYLAEGVEKGIKSSKQDWRVIIDIIIKSDPSLLFRITRKMFYYLTRTQNANVEKLMKSLSCPAGPNAKPTDWCGINMPNTRQDLDALKRVQEGVFEIAAESIPPEEITDLLTVWLKQDRARSLLLAAQKRGISLVDITDTLYRFSDIPDNKLMLSPEDDISIRTNLLRRFFTERLEFINIAKRYIRVDDIVTLLDEVVGPAQGVGKLGGKSSGVYLAEKIICREMEKNPDLGGISFAKSWYITSDTMWDIIHFNALDEVAHIKYLDPKNIRHEQPFIEQVFKNAAFSPEIVDGLRRILREVGEKPIIVRSSSLLEDSYGAAFSGKYKSLFLTNIGSEEEKLNALMDAIGEVYASTFAPDPIEYRKERGLLDFIEEMGILIQEVVGNRIGPYFFPAFAGVAFSNNEFRWSPRIRREDGIVRMVVGLGTRAVDRVDEDYPVLVSPNRPEIRVNAFVDETIRYSQKYMDVLNLEKRTLETVKVDDILKRYGDDYPDLNRIVSVHKDGSLVAPSGLILDPGRTDMVVTFSGIIEQSRFIPQMKTVLNLLKKTLGTPVDVEFASDGKNLYILQCRPQSQGEVLENISIPSKIPEDRKLFSVRKYVTTGLVENVEYLVYVDPEAYESLENREDMMNVARAVSDLNSKLPKGKFVLMGPGRWGSRGDIKLGVPVQYRDINNTSLLVEMAKKKGGYRPELSFGTHFFQDLVEARIHYLPIYFGEKGIMLNERLLSIAPNRLEEICPGRKDLEDVVKLIEVSDLITGGTLSVIMDGESNKALGYLVPPDHWVWRMDKVEEMASKLNTERYGVKALYVVGSTKNATAGAASDIDLIVHFSGDQEQGQDLLAWFDEWSRKLDRENYKRTGVKTEGILDVHLITDEDIEKRSSWATHIDSMYGSAKKIPLKDEVNEDE